MSDVKTRSAAEEAWELMLELFATHRPTLTAAAGEHGLTPQQAWALRRLDPERPLPMSDLAGILGCDASNVTGIVDRLESRGLVERRPDEHDRRVRNLVVTGPGEAVRATILRALHTPPPPLAALGAADQRRLRDALRTAVSGAG